MKSTFTCDRCGGVFPSDDEDEAVAAEEAKRLWGITERSSDTAVLCDDCFEKFMGWHKAQVN